MIKTSFFDLPWEIKLYCFSFLNVKETIELSHVCTDWKQLANDQCLWSRFLPNYVLDPPSDLSGEQMRKAICEVCVTAWKVRRNQGEERLVGRVMLDPKPIQAGKWVVFMGEERRFVRLWNRTEPPFNIEATVGRFIIDWTVLNPNAKSPVLVLLEQETRVKGSWLHLWSVGVESKPSFLKTMNHKHRFYTVSRVRPLNSDREQLVVAALDKIHLLDPFRETLESVSMERDPSEEIGTRCTFVKGVGSGLVVQWRSALASRLMLFECTEGSFPKKQAEVLRNNPFDEFLVSIDKLVEAHGSSWANARAEIASIALQERGSSKGFGVHQIWGDHSGLFVDQFRTFPNHGYSVVVQNRKIRQQFRFKGAMDATWITGLAGLVGIPDYLVVPRVRRGDSENKLAIELIVRRIPREKPHRPKMVVETSHPVGLQAAPVPGVLGAIAVRIPGHDTRIFLFGPVSK